MGGLNVMEQVKNETVDPQLERVDSDMLEESEPGLDEATLRSYPTVLYSEAKFAERGTTITTATTTTVSCCSICLVDYEGTDVLRLLPDCGHLFHLQCVDLWLRCRPTCPVCRSSPLPSPLPSPLAEIIPLANQS